MINLLKNTLLLFSLAIVLASCSGLKGFEKTVVKTEPDINHPAPLSGNFKQALYKAQMDAFGRHFSGLFLIKPVPEDTSYRVVLLSEFGLNLLDLSLNKTTTTVVNCEEFLNRRVVINAIGNNIRMLLFVPEDEKSLKKYRNSETGEVVIKSKKGCKRSFYRFDDEGSLTKIDQRKGLFNKQMATLTFENASFPAMIFFESRPVKQTMKLTLLNLEK